MKRPDFLTGFPQKNLLMILIWLRKIGMVFRFIISKLQQYPCHNFVNPIIKDLLQEPLTSDERLLVAKETNSRTCQKNKIMKFDFQENYYVLVQIIRHSFEQVPKD